MLVAQRVIVVGYRKIMFPRFIGSVVGEEADRSTGCVLGVIGRVDGEEGRLRISEREHLDFVGLWGYEILIESYFRNSGCPPQTDPSST